MTSATSRPSPRSDRLPLDPWTVLADRARAIRSELATLHTDALDLAAYGPASTDTPIARSTMKQRLSTAIAGSASTLSNVERIARNESGRISTRFVR